MISRRGFLGVLAGLAVAPMVVRAEALMPLRGYRMLPFIEVPSWCPAGWVLCTGQRVGRAQFPELYDQMRRRRQYGAHLSDSEFELPSADLTSIGPYGLRIWVPIVSATRMVRSNSSIAAPGFTAQIEVSKEDLENSQSGFLPHQTIGYDPSSRLQGG